MINFSRGKEDNRFNINNPSLRTWNKVERYFYIRIRVRIFRQFIRYIYIYNNFENRGCNIKNARWIIICTVLIHIQFYLLDILFIILRFN